MTNKVGRHYIEAFNRRPLKCTGADTRVLSSVSESGDEPTRYAVCQTLHKFRPSVETHIYYAAQPGGMPFDDETMAQKA